MQKKINTINPAISRIASPIYFPIERVSVIFLTVIPYVTPTMIKRKNNIGTIPVRKGDGTIPPSSFVSGEFGRKMMLIRKAI